MTTRGITSPQAYARTAGALYLVIIVAASFAEFFVRGHLVVPGDATATADNIMAAPALFRVAFASDAVAFLCDVALAMIFYVLLRPVSQPLALLAAFFRLAQGTILGVNLVNHLAAGIVLSGAAYLSAFEPAQLHALALVFLEAHAYGYDTALVFFGMHCVVAGTLLWRSRYFPAALGALLALAGMGYLVDSFTSVVAPAYDALVEPFVLVPAVVGELALTLWLLVKGVNLERWNARVAPGGG